MTNHFDVKEFATKSYCSHIRSVLARIKLQFAKAINEELKLPRICVFVLDDDIIRYLRLDIQSATSILNEIIPWLFKEIAKLIQIRKDQLPRKAVKEGYPQIYWMEAPQHVNFSNNMIRRKFNSVVQNVAMRYANMRIARMKKIWDPEEKYLFMNSRFSADGLMKYWESIDNAIEFNENLKKAKWHQQSGSFSQKGFRKQTNSTSDAVHWGKNSQKRFEKEHQDNEFRFRMPKPRSLDFY